MIQKDHLVYDMFKGLGEKMKGFGGKISGIFGGLFGKASLYLVYY